MADEDVQQGHWGSKDFEQLAQRYWGEWSDAMRKAASAGGSHAGAHAGMQAWHDAIDWWTRQAHGNRTGVNDALERFNTQGRTWFGQMQQIAAQFAGRDSTARDIAAAWRESLGASGENPFPEIFRTMRGHGLQGLDKWIEDASPYLDATLREGKSWLGMPAFGVGREHQERLQQLAQAQLEYQQANSAYNALMLKASQSAFEIFEDKLIEHEEPGRQIESPRALFDLWIDAAEEAYAEIALSLEFRRAYGELADSQMRLRAGIQAQIEQAARLFDLPTRSELDGAHRKIVELERAVRRLRDAVGSGQGNGPGSAQAALRPSMRKPAKKAARKAVKKAAKRSTRKAAKPASKQARKTAAKKAAKKATKKTTTKKAAVKKSAATARKRSEG
ncbi:MAG: class III poly(R)-hydroxyalkanoic acid synthase subunit PhaE [Luteimonas sp.]